MDIGIQTDRHTRQYMTSAREWGHEEEPRMLVLTLSFRKWLGDLGKITSPLWARTPGEWRAWGGQLIQRIGRDLGDLMPHPFLGETVVQRREMTCLDHAAIFTGPANTGISPPGSVFCALVRNNEL